MTNPQYWRMQMHPNTNNYSAYYAHQCIGKGFIGLDFANPAVGDLRIQENHDIASKQSEFIKFQSDMSSCDRVLIVSRNLPLVVVTVASNYQYNANAQSELGIWCRHYRCIKNPLYFSDYATKGQISDWMQYTMTSTIEMVKETTGTADLINKMLAWDVENDHQKYSLHS